MRCGDRKRGEVGEPSEVMVARGDHQRDEAARDEVSTLRAQRTVGCVAFGAAGADWHSQIGKQSRVVANGSARGDGDAVLTGPRETTHLSESPAYKGAREQFAVP